MEPVFSALVPHLIGRLVLPQPDVNRVAQQIVGRPGQMSVTPRNPFLWIRRVLDPFYCARALRRGRRRLGRYLFSRSKWY
jgi:hypothetical protein